MRILQDDCIYDFRVMRDDTQQEVISTDHTLNDFQIKLRYRKFSPSSRSPEIEHQSCVQIARANIVPAIANMLMEFDLPVQARDDMAAHLQFYINEKIIRRRDFIRRGVITVAVNLDVKVITQERIAAIRGRMDAAAAGNRVVARRVEVEEVAAGAAEKAAVDELERVCVGDEEERECAICLERFGVGAGAVTEAIKMPCSHIYHEECIIRWLQRNCFCPFCRFKLPSC